MCWQAAPAVVGGGAWGRAGRGFRAQQQGGGPGVPGKPRVGLEGLPALEARAPRQHPPPPAAQSREEPGGWAGSGRGRAQAVLPALLGVLGAATPVASRVPAVAALARSDAARAQAGFLLTAGPRRSRPECGATGSGLGTGSGGETPASGSTGRSPGRLHSAPPPVSEVTLPCAVGAGGLPIAPL